MMDQASQPHSVAGDRENRPEKALETYEHALTAEIRALEKFDEACGDCLKYMPWPRSRHRRDVLVDRLYRAGQADPAAQRWLSDKGVPELALTELKSRWQAAEICSEATLTAVEAAARSQGLQD
ncbi:hypothetical protein, partial [Azospirillum sp. B4]|uniref:hypothetical protein n=1 Tax=Azospirillum sp. B4 TaxID=95605 RepID=UPI0011DE0902